MCAGVCMCQKISRNFLSVRMEMKLVVHRLCKILPNIVSDSFHLVKKTIVIFKQISKILKVRNSKTEKGTWQTPHWNPEVKRK